MNEEWIKKQMNSTRYARVAEQYDITNQELREIGYSLNKVNGSQSVDTT
jgi:hypothetical protein